MGKPSDVVLQLLPSPALGSKFVSVSAFSADAARRTAGGHQIRTLSKLQKKEIRKQREDANAASHGPSSRFARLESGALDRTRVIDRSPLFPSRSLSAGSGETTKWSALSQSEAGDCESTGDTPPWTSRRAEECGGLWSSGSGHGGVAAVGRP